MVDFAEFTRQREASKVFTATELGKLFVAYQHALINYWKNDANDHISNRKLRELDDKAREAEKAFVAKLMELA